jgi:hypothetical protein
LHTWNVFDALPPSHIAIFGSVQCTTDATPRSLLEFELMFSTPHHVGLNDFDFGADFGDFGGDFDPLVLTQIFVPFSVMSTSLTSLRVR